MVSSIGAIPAGATLLLAFLALVALKFIILNHTLAVPNAAVKSAKEGDHMKRVKVIFTSVLDTIHGLGVSGLASCLLAKGSLLDNVAAQQYH